MRSWLAKARSVHDIGGQFYHPLGGEPWDERRDARAETRWQNAGVEPTPVAERDLPYYGCRMHDSTLLGIERTGSDLRVRLGSVHARDFARALANVLGVPPKPEIYPVTLVLHDVRYVRAAHADLRGGLRFVDWESLEETEFLYDWFFEQGNRLQWIAQIWRGQQGHGYDWANVYLMVDCVRASAEDLSPDVFARLHGPPAAQIYRDAVAGIDERPIEFDVFDSAETEKYIRRRMAVHGSLQGEFAPE